MIILVIGGCDSGKSEFAENLIYKNQEKYNEVFYIATYNKNLNEDPEMMERIKRHKERRDKRWKVLEISEINEIIKIMRQISNSIIFVDSITMLVSYELMNKNKDEILKNFENMIKEMKENKNLFILVSNEVGMGITPENELSRNFEYTLGKINQIISKNSENVYFVIAGIPVLIK